LIWKEVSFQELAIECLLALPIKVTFGDVKFLKVASQQRGDLESVLE
jgi:hypothetical protein